MPIAQGLFQQSVNLLSLNWEHSDIRQPFHICKTSATILIRSCRFTRNEHWQ